MTRILFFIALSLSLVLSFSLPAVAGYDEGEKAYKTRNWPVAIKELRPLAEAGDDRAMLMIGMMYAQGWGVLKSHTEAMRLFKRAATEKNNTEAMDNIGAMYSSGLGVDRSVKTAREWFHRSALLGDPQGAFFYAGIIAGGDKDPLEGVAADPYNAYKWLRIAASEKTNDNLKKLCLTMAAGIGRKLITADQMMQADKEIADWKPVAVKDLGPFPEEPAPRQKSPVRPGPVTPLDQKPSPDSKILPPGHGPAY